MVSKLLNFWTSGTILFFKRGQTASLLPLQIPFRAVELAPKLHSSPLVWSQGCVLLQSSLSCLARTLQQPQASRTSPTPGAHLGASRGQWQAVGQVERAWKGGEETREAPRGTQERRPRKGRGCLTRAAGEGVF